MHHDVRALAAYYRSGPGGVARASLAARLAALWPAMRGRDLLGFGYATPYLDAVADGAARVVAVMPAAQGVTAWPPGARPRVALTDEDAFPFADESFTHVLVVHGIETSDALRPLMRQLWRVLAPEGRLLVVVPNRASLWAQIETSPFGQGRPFTRGQLDRMLREAMLVPERWEAALHFPPFGHGILVGTGAAWERLGRRAWGGLAGVHIVECSKSLFALAPAGGTRRRAVTPVRA